MKDSDGATPLHYVAMHCEREQCAALLCAAGASVRSRNHGNTTAVQVARSEEVRSFHKKLQRTPPKLEHFCLLVIRERLGTNLENKTESLPLPKSLKDKILFKTLPRVINNYIKNEEQFSNECLRADTKVIALISRKTHSIRITTWYK